MPMHHSKASGNSEFTKAPQADVVIENHSTIFLFRPLSESARAWIEENVSREGLHPDWPTLVVEHHYAGNLAAGMQADGLVLR
jgi:hypothetical protein